MTGATLRDGVRRRTSSGALAVAALAALVALTAPERAAAQEHHHGKDTTAAVTAAPGRAPEIPRSLREEHAAIHARLVAATKMPGEVGASARAVAEVLDPHFVREEQIALPPLGLLRTLLDGVATPSMAAVLPLTDSLRAELPAMLTQHEAIGVALQRLGRVAKRAGNREAARLADDIRLHALNEEEVLYPAAVLVGELARARLRSASARTVP